MGGHFAIRDRVVRNAEFSPALATPSGGRDRKRNAAATTEKPEIP